MRTLRSLCFVYFLCLLFSGPTFAGPSGTNGDYRVNTPQLLNWERDASFDGPDLTEPTSRGLDLHGMISNCDNVDIVLSTAGNYHMALRDIWTKFLQEDGAALGVSNWFYTTSPPITLEQIQQGGVRFGNFILSCRPSIVVATKKYLVEKLMKAGVIEGEPAALYESNGMVLLVKKGNPKHIRTVWDLARDDVRVVTPNVHTGEPVDAYAQSLYNIAANDPAPPANMNPDKLYATLFQSQRQTAPGADVHGCRRSDKWLVGTRIHHREGPWSVAYGCADVGTVFAHIALDAVRQFPALFEIVPLGGEKGGTAENPTAAPGNITNVHYVAYVRADPNHPWTKKQLLLRERLRSLLLSDGATRIFASHHLARP